MPAQGLTSGSALAPPVGARLGERLQTLLHLPRRVALAHLVYRASTPLFGLRAYRWLLTGSPVTSLTLSPSDPWPGDASLGSAILRGEFDFLGRTISEPEPLWAPRGADRQWLMALHGFAWLRDLRTAGGDRARRTARQLVGSWMEEHAVWSSLAWHPTVMGQRLSHWLGQYDFFAASGEIQFRHQLFDLTAQQARHLARVLPAGITGSDLIAALKGLIYAGICLPGGATWRQKGMALLMRELDRQILPDGGHIERSPSRHLEVMCHLIDIRALLRSADLPMPEALQATIEEMAGVLCLFRHGDGGLAVFNNSNEDEDWRINMVLQRAGGRARSLRQAPASGFQRLQAGRLVAVVDAGAPPPAGYDRQAHAGTASLEVSVGRQRLIVNCGAFAGDRAWRQAQRMTAAHSTVGVGDQSSSYPFPDRGLRGHRPRVVVEREDLDGACLLTMVHDGYYESLGVTHRRRIYLAPSGDDLRGEDRLTGPGETTFTARFHLHPSVSASRLQSGDTILLRLPDGVGWKFRAAGVAAGLEDSVYLGREGEIRRSQQIVLSGRLKDGESVVKWGLSRQASKPKARSPSKTL